MKECTGDIICCLSSTKAVLQLLSQSTVIACRKFIGSTQLTTAHVDSFKISDKAIEAINVLQGVDVLHSMEKRLFNKPLKISTNPTVSETENFNEHRTAVEKWL